VGHYHGLQGIETEGHRFRLGLGQEAVDQISIFNRGQFSSIVQNSHIISSTISVYFKFDIIWTNIYWQVEMESLA